MCGFSLANACLKFESGNKALDTAARFKPLQFLLLKLIIILNNNRFAILGSFRA